MLEHKNTDCLAMTKSKMKGAKNKQISDYKWSLNRIDASVCIIILLTTTDWMKQNIRNSLNKFYG